MALIPNDRSLDGDLVGARMDSAPTVSSEENVDSHQMSPKEAETMDEPRGVVTWSQARKLLHDLHKGLATFGAPSPSAAEAITMLARIEEADSKGILPPTELKLGTHVKGLFRSQGKLDVMVEVANGAAMTRTDAPACVRRAAGPCQEEDRGRSGVWPVRLI